MAGAGEPPSFPPQSLGEAAIRLLRHEVGDLLQTVYATAALLQQRLPSGWELERRILSDMRARGESCRGLLDLVHDLLCPMNLAPEPVDFSELLTRWLAGACERHPALSIRPDLDTVPPIQADRQKIDQLGRLVLADACAAAVRQVLVHLSVTPDGKEVHWDVSSDGEILPRLQLAHYFTLERTGYEGPSSLCRALARRIVQLHGGRIDAENLSEGGFRIGVSLPAAGQVRTE